MDLDQLHSVQAWNSCLEQNTSQPCTGLVLRGSALALCFCKTIPGQCPLLSCCSWLPILLSHRGRTSRGSRLNSSTKLAPTLPGSSRHTLHWEGAESSGNNSILFMHQTQAPDVCWAPRTVSAPGQGALEAQNQRKCLPPARVTGGLRSGRGLPWTSAQQGMVVPGYNREESEVAVCLVIYNLCY